MNDNKKGQKGINYSDFCGEFHTSSAFALALAWNIITGNTSGFDDIEKCDNILIHRVYQEKYHSIMLLGRN